MRAMLAVLLAGLAAGCSPAADPARPKAILLIRHAEKSTDATETGLSPAGRKRADALPALFAITADRPDPFPTPDFVFATKASAKSNRPVETVTPLAKALQLNVTAEYPNADYPKLAKELLSDPRYAGKTVLVCWHQGNLPELATAFGASGVPGNWRDEVFDRAWVVTFDARGKARPLADRPQALMPGDGKE